MKIKKLASFDQFYEVFEEISFLGLPCAINKNLGPSKKILQLVLK